MVESFLSIIVPVYNGGEGFRYCLQAIVQSDYRSWELIVVDDGSTDGSETIAQAYANQVLTTPKRQSGPATARNLGAKVATGEYLLFLDADCLVHSDTLTNLVWFLRNHPDVDAVFGSYDDAPYETNFLSQYKNLFHHYMHQTGSEDASTFWAGCGAIRRQTFLAVGGFDESYQKPCIEDIELGYRLKAAGYQIKLCKSVQVKHLKRWEPLSLLKAEIFYRALPWTDLILTSRQPVNDLNLQLSSRASVVLTGLSLLFLVAGIWWSGFYLLSIVVLGALLWINSAVYRFFYEKRGLVFSLRVIPWHLLYYLYGGGAFAIGLLRHWLSLLKPEKNSALSVSESISD
ncbi:MAG: glycosyltransferase family 2 protein [Cyanobacteria bacterium]|nr:glycosyltransferase family 2 protein [Cyanobacteriota bacterium]MDW8200392.1 glycosyltransferase family 2 protein [Cyanobacteriota bacterium SKYGB_h_bin112]